MTLNERFVGGNPQVLLLLFCLSFVGICPNMMRKSKKILKPLTKNQTNHIKKKNFFFSFKKKKNHYFFQKVGTGRANPKKKKILKKIK